MWEGELRLCKQGWWTTATPQMFALDMKLGKDETGKAPGYELWWMREHGGETNKKAEGVR